MRILDSLRTRGMAVLCALLPVVFPLTVAGQASPYRGLWVGTVSLQAVNEVSVPLDAANVPVAPDPEVPTPTHDQAHLRLLIHVNGAGQAFLLKDVAILNRVAGSDPAAAVEVFARETDLALVTDPRLYSEFDPQPAVRIAAAAFDFGDFKATEALDAIVEEAATLATDFVMDPTLVLDTQAQRVQARNDAIDDLLPTLNEMAENADVAEAFGQFVTQVHGLLGVIINDPSDPQVTDLLADAATLRDQSFYGDARGVEMVETIIDAVQAAGTSAEKTAAANNTAAAFADVGNQYQRFISGKVFGDMIVAAVAEVASAAQAPGATAASIETALRATPEAIEALTEAIQIKAQPFADTRADDAIDAVLGAMAEAALLSGALTAAEIRSSSEAAARAALAEAVARYSLPVLTPTLDYNAFITSLTFSDVPQQAAFAAAQAAIEERATNPLYTPLSVFNAAKLGALNALQTPFSTAARVMRTELPLAGEFAPGAGDPRAIMALTQPSDLGPAGLEGRIYLPANHPTNPFRHRRHPDHRTGYNIERLIRLDFDGVTGDPLESAGYGVDRITGVYREEIFGLHKPLGPEPDTNPIGLRTEGPFELNRISLIDTLNTR